jgi:5-methylcytosine-specific restriction enzyme subunit McrC
MEQLRSTGQDVAAIPIKNVWYLLLYAWELGRWRGSHAERVEVAPDLKSLLAAVLVDSCKALLRQQLGRQFGKVTGTVRGLRGKIDVSASVKRNTFQRGETACMFPELTVDTLPNRILRSTLSRLASDPRLGELGAPDHAERLRDEVRRAGRLLEDVPLVRLQGSDFSRLQLTRNEEVYRLPLSLCWLLYAIQVPADASGDALLVSLLRDEMRFSQIFETFVRNFFRLHLTGCSVSRERLAWPIEGEGDIMPGMETDVTVSRSGLHPRRVVVDTKYYPDYLTTRYGSSRKAHATNLYQMYAYLRTQEGRGDAFDSAAGVLLYPAGVAEGLHRYRIQGHDLIIATVNLGADWAHIENNLLGLMQSVLAVN